MSKQVYVASVQPEVDGPVFGRVINPEQMHELQVFAHEHIEVVTKDLLVAGATSAQVAGFSAAVTTGLSVSVGTGHAVDQNGLSYQTGEDATVVAMAAAHVSLPRIDLIYATLEIDAPVDSEYRPFRQLRTLVELEAGRIPYVPVQYNQPTELHTRATIGVRTGTPNASPAAPAAGASEVALWQVHVAANQVTLVGGDLTSVRTLMRSLYQVYQDLLVLAGQVNSGLGEIVQDIVGAFVTASSSIVFTYNDPGGTLTLNLHPTYKGMLDDATDAATASKLVKRDASGNCSIHKLTVTEEANGARPVLLLLANTGLGNGSGSTIEFREHNDLAAKIVQDYNVQTPFNDGCLRFYCGKLSDGFVPAEIFRVDALTPHASVFGNLSVSGSVSKGGGTFLIDHPLDPDDKDLVHGFIEGPRYDLLYRGRVQLVAGEAVVNVDEASGMTAGTFVALCHNAQVVSLLAETGWDKVRVKTGVHGLVYGGEFTIECDNPASTAWVGWLLIAERNDPYILAAGETDEDGHLIVERDKPAPNLDLLDPETREVEGEEDGQVVFEEVVRELVGTQGYRRHADITGEGIVPMKEVTIITTAA
jgi:hypothetical protein